MSLDGCKIAEASTNDGGLERHEIEQEHASNKPQDEDDALERKKMGAASIILSAMATRGPSVSRVYVDDAQHASVTITADNLDPHTTAKVSHVKACIYRIDSNLVFGTVVIDFSKFTGEWRTYNTRWGEKLVMMSNGGSSCQYESPTSKNPICSSNISVTGRQGEQIRHDLQFLLDNGCGQSVRGPDPY